MAPEQHVIPPSKEVEFGGREKPEGPTVRHRNVVSTRRDPFSDDHDDDYDANNTVEIEGSCFFFTFRPKKPVAFTHAVWLETEF
ncbi:hypothetical protein HPB50_012832 [Hyalomma asiaticum]|uniref:Uncharacterized protein n=1 Tax=Hyalomma asiaticum TaxID=266040 RepID=A0ACB7S991_HYAAI|nr:hypothetical protein HPB50_012832 [Hyalomma asiaticum]